MIIDRDTKPERQLYHQGGRLIGVLSDMPGRNVDLFTAFEQINRQESVSMGVFILTLDWLFLLEVVAYKEGRIVKCF